MSHNIVFERDAQIARIVLHGSVSVADILDALDAITSDGVFVCKRRLWDLRGCQLNVTAQELQQVAKVGQSRDVSGSRGALLADDDLNFGLSRLHEIYRQSEFIEVKVFRDELQALTWLMES